MFATAVGFLIARAMASVAYGYKRQEIRDTKVFDKEIQSCELIDAKLGEFVHFMAGLLEPFEIPEFNENIPPQDRARVLWEKRAERIDETLHELTKLMHANYLFTPPGVGADINDMRSAACKAIRDLFQKIENKHPGSNEVMLAWQEALPALRSAEESRRQLTEKMRLFLFNPPLRRER